MVNRLLLLSTLRHLGWHRWQTRLSIIGIALGVAIIVAVDLANQSARQAFLLSAESLTGKASHQIVAGAAGIPEALYRELRMEHGLRRSAPVVEGLVRQGAEQLQLIGVDPLAEEPFRQLSAELGSNVTRRLLSEPDSVLLSRITAERLGITTDDPLVVTIAGRPTRLRIAGLLEGDNPALMEGLLLADISTAQELLERNGRLDRIDLILDPQQAVDLASILPQGLRLEVPAARTRVMAEMIEAFQTFHHRCRASQALVGAFLIYNTMAFSVLRRRKLLATLRILGVTRQSLFRLLMLEAALLGLVGTGLGLLLGTLTAHYLVQLVTRTINDLYFVLTVTRLMVEPMILLKGVLVGLGVTLLAALAPAVEAAGTLPTDALRRSHLEQRVQRGLPWLSLSGLVTLVVGLFLVTQETHGLVSGFSALFLIIGGYGLLVPLAVTLLSRFGSRLANRRGLLTRYALRGIHAHLSRTALSISALSVAVAATLGVSIMITSFRTTVADWLSYTLRSDIYVSALYSHATGRDGHLRPQTRSLIQSLEVVTETSSGRRVNIDSQYGPVDLLAIEMASRSQKGFHFVDRPLAGIWPRYRGGEVVLISEPYAYRHDLKTGDELLLHTPGGPVTRPIGGIFYDYGSDQGLISLARPTYARLWEDPGISTVGIFLRPEVSTATAIDTLRNILDGQDDDLRIRSNREIREHSMAVFDRTFAITQVLRMLAIGVAFIGVLSALMALQLDLTREQAVLRATGATPAQLFGLTLLQTGLMGLYAGLLSLPLGWIMSEVLIEVINRRSFGWSIMTQLPPVALIEALLLALGAALLAGIYPAWRMGRVRLAMALREE